METFADDLRYVAELAGIPEWIKAAAEVRLNPSSASIQQITMERFEEISDSQKMRLVEMYRLDFEAFGYEFQPYIT